MVGCVPGKGCYFRGEEKRIGSREDPRSELHHKMAEVWPFSGLPYVLGYHSNCAIVSFAKIMDGSVTDIAGPLNLDRVSDRLMCWNITRNVARLLNFMLARDTTNLIP